MIDLRKLFRRDVPPSVEIMADAAKALEADLANAQARRDALRHGRRSILLEGTQAEATAHEAKLDEAELQVERLELQIAELGERIAAEESRRGAAAERAVVDDAERRADAAAGRAAEYRKLAEQMILLLTEMQRADEAVASVNRRRIGAAPEGPFRHLRDVPAIATVAERLAEHRIVGGLPPAALWSLVTLPDPGAPETRSIWP